MKNFQALGLDPELNASLAKMGYEKPTPIQAQAIPFALDGKDVMGTAQTGTGKTAAFAIPLMQRLLDDPKSEALVLVPTRELGKQIMDVMKQLIGHKGKIKTAFIIGGEPMSKQMNQLKNRPRLVVGTPGRINDHLQRGTLDLSNTNFLVLDETDRMLDMGFSVQLERIFKYMPEKRQTLMFSATMPKNILDMSHQYMNKPERVRVGETNVVAVNIKTEVIKIDQSQKYDALRLQLHERDGSVIIFIKTKHGADRMAKNLRRDGFTADALHGDLRQSKREKVMQNFRNDNFRILVATDIAARGLDVPNIQHVINYDLPQVAEDYIHRMGRTARAGTSGSALCFVSPADGRKWHAIECLLDPNKKSNDRQYDKTKPKRRKSNAAGGRAGEKRDFKRGDGKKPYAKRDDRKSGAGKKEGSWSKDKPKKRAHSDRPEREGDEKRNFKKPYPKKRYNDSNNDNERSENSFKKPYAKKHQGDDGSQRSDRPNRDSDQKRSFKKPYQKREGADEQNGEKPFKKPYKQSRNRNKDERSDKPQFDKPRGNKPIGDKPKSFKSGSKKSKPANASAFGGKPIKKKNAKKPNAKKSNF